MKVAICTDMYLPQLGGVADSVVLQARGLRALGHDVHIFAAHMRGETPDPAVTRFASVELFGGTFCVLSPFGIASALAAYAPDVIHVHSFGTIGMMARRASKRLGIPAVGTNHGSPVDYLHYFYLNVEPFRYLALRFVAWFYSGFSIVTSPAASALDTLAHAGLKHVRTEVISNAVDSHTFRRLNDKQTLKERIGIAHRAVPIFGRLAEEKNLDEALKVFADVHARTGAQLVLVGDGPYRAALEARVRRIGVAEHTFFMGRLSEDPLVATINACDVMLTTSRSEVQPMTILQANMCGIPVVGARAGGIPDCIEDGVTGFVVDPGDIGAFSDHVSRLIADETLAQKMSDAATARAKGLEPAAVARAWERLYRTLPGVL